MPTSTCNLLNGQGQMTVWVKIMIETATIQKCFAKCGFQALTSQQLSDDYDHDHDIPLKVVFMPGNCVLTHV